VVRKSATVDDVGANVLSSSVVGDRLLSDVSVLGDADGAFVGDSDGSEDGFEVDRNFDGVNVGLLDGLAFLDGAEVGVNDGFFVGVCVGD
jgi:hypothetical protein